MHELPPSKRVMTRDAGTQGRRDAVGTFCWQAASPHDLQLQSEAAQLSVPGHEKGLVSSLSPWLSARARRPR